MPSRRWHGRPQWLQRFGWGDLDAAAPVDDAVMWSPVVSLEIDGIEPKALYRVQVTRGGERVCDIVSHEGATGHVSSAGEILAAMASMRGGCGLSLGTTELGQRISLALLAVRLCVLAAEPMQAECVRVHARLG